MNLGMLIILSDEQRKSMRQDAAIGIFLIVSFMRFDTASTQSSPAGRER
ncbi:hypothetical protein NTG1052_40006 [Candidatus Nitrotoga sp. 1052]|nr:hypothetical protein NTG1052_40006 [Candidatus Nitrotoga sp. 1052]